MLDGARARAHRRGHRGGPRRRRGPPARFHRGDAVGFIEERIVAWGEPAETLEVVLGELGREAELVTLIAGDGAPLDGDAVAALAPAGVELEYSWGGQPAYWWLISAE